MIYMEIYEFFRLAYKSRGETDSLAGVNRVPQKERERGGGKNWISRHGSFVRRRLRSRLARWCRPLLVVLYIAVSLHPTESQQQGQILFFERTLFLSFYTSQETKGHKMNRLYVSIYFHQNTILIIVAVVFILSRKDHDSWDCFINHFIKVVCKKIKEVTRTKASIILQYTGSIIGIIIIIIAMDTSNMTFKPFSSL